MAELRQDRVSASVREKVRVPTAPATTRRGMPPRPTESRISPGLLFVVPALIMVALFIVYPLVDTIRLSFFAWNGISATQEWVGVDNYIELLTNDPYFWTGVRNTLIWMAVSVPGQVLTGFFLADLLNRTIIGKIAFRSVFFLPAVMSSVVIAFAWSWIYNPDIGVATRMLQLFGQEGQAWLGEPATALWAIILTSIWRYSGFIMVFYLAAMQMIPESVYEAARVDGASARQQRRHITWPILSPMTALLILLGSIGAIREFEIIWILTRGGPAHATDLLSIQVFDQAFNLSRQGYASAIAVVMLVWTAIAGAVSLILINRAQGSVD